MERGEQMDTVGRELTPDECLDEDSSTPEADAEFEDELERINAAEREAAQDVDIRLF